MTRKVTFAQNEYYHIYNRGVEKRPIFSDKASYDRFLVLMYLCNTKEPIRLPRDFTLNLREIFSTKRTEQLIEVCAYCLMPNHFHLLVKEGRENGKGISQYMQKLTTAYTMYFNTRNSRSGSLFQGVFRAKHANQDEYLKYLYSAEGQEIAARHQLRPRSAATLAKYAKDFPKVSLFTIDEAFGGWSKAQKEHFDDGAIFDQILAAARK